MRGALTALRRRHYGADLVLATAPAVPRVDRHAAFPCWRIEDRGAIVAFSTRRGGVSPPPFDSLNLGRSTDDDPAAVAENRRRFLSSLDLDPERVATAG